MEPSNISIIIPALNEERAIAQVIDGLIAALPEAEVIVVDDGSTDATGELARKAGARVIRHERNSGYGAGLRTGVEASEREYVLFCDADGQHSASDARALIEACDGQDMIVGARGDESHTPLSRRPGKFIIKWFANCLAGCKIPDVNSGLRLIKRDVLRRYMHLMPSGFSFSTTSTFAFLKSNRQIKYIPITVGQRSGRSTVRQWKHGPQTLMLMLRLIVLFEPLKVFLSVAGVLFALSLASLLADLSRGGETGISDTTVILFIAMLVVFMSGLVCDQVSALRREIHE